MTARVLLDCDGVLSDFMGGVMPLINSILETSYTVDDVTEFSFAAALKLTPDQASAVKRSIGRTPRLAANLNVYPGAVDGVRRIREIAEIYVVTSSWDSNETWEFDRKAWLKRHFDIGHHDIVFTAAKHICVGDVFVDDRTETLAKWLEHHPTGTAVQWQTPHNRRDRWNGWSTNSWDELFRIVEFVRPFGTEVVA